MAFVVEETYRRPSPTTPWWRGQSQHKRKVTEKATKAGDLVWQGYEQTDDPLVATYKAVWQDRESYERWVLNDKVVQAYNAMVAEYLTRFDIVTERREYYL